MLAIEGFVRILVIVFLGVVSFGCFNAHGRDCYEVGNKMVCYFQPNESYIEMTWDDAWKVCKENNSTLPVIGNRMIEETLKRHLESKKSLSGDMWLAGREIRTTVWQWLNGKPFGQQNSFINTHRSSYQTNAVITGQLQYKSVWSNAGRINNYICHYNDSELCHIESIIPWKNGCLFVNNDEQLNLVDSRNRCLDDGGDLASFEEDENLQMLQETDSSLLQKYKDYWIGLRLTWWIWNKTDSSEEIKYSNWTTYDYRLNEECIRFSDYKWKQGSCSTKKPFICQTVTTTAERSGTDAPDANAPLIELHTAIIIGAIAVVVVVIFTVVLVIILKRSKNKRIISHPTDEKLIVPHEMSTPQIQNKSFKSKAIEVDEMTNHYAEIPRAVGHENDDECRDEPQPGILYAALEFDANKAIYEEPVISSQRKKEASAPTMVGALNGNGQPGSSAESPTQAAEGTIYANM